MPQRYLASANRMPKKKEEREAPPSVQPISRFPACQYALPENIEALRGRTPIHGKFYRGHARYACRRTSRQTSGLPAGAEPSFESKDIIASTNPNRLDAYENYRAAGLHAYRYTGLFAYAVSFLASIESTSLRATRLLAYMITQLQDHTPAHIVCYRTNQPTSAQ